MPKSQSTNASSAQPTPLRALRPVGRSATDFLPLSVAEEILREACKTGDVAKINEQRPSQPTPQNTIRPGFLRFVALGGDETLPVHEKGVRIEGAWIKGSLDLVACHLRAPLMLEKCAIEGNVVLRNAHIVGLNLPGCHIDGLFANRLVCDGSIFLRDGFCADGEVRLGGARIGGNLSFSGASMKDKGAKSLSMAGIRVRGALVFQELTELAGTVSFAGGEATMYADDESTLKKATELKLDGFRFHRFTKGAPSDAKTRIAFLEKQPDHHLTSDFRGQPWEQMISVMRRMGHGDDADIVAISKQTHMRRAGYFNRVARVFHWLFGVLAGYGYRPARTVLSMITVWAICALVYGYAGTQGWMGPSSPLIHSNSKYADACRSTGWTSCKQVPPEYTTFQPWFYSLDLIMPLVRLQQDTDWAPVVVTPAGKPIQGGLWTRRLMWFEILFGWAASLLLVAVLSNLVKKD